MFLSREEQALAIAALPEHYRPLGAFLFASGCRIGEALALEPADIGPGTVSFTKSRSRRAEGEEETRKFTTGPAKTESSERTISMPQDVLDQLDLSHEFVFVTESGQPINGDSFRARVWHRAMARSGLAPTRRPGIHDTRHTHASRLLDAGIPVLAVSKRLGHANVGTTMTIYAHVAADADARILAALAS